MADSFDPVALGAKPVADDKFDPAALGAKPVQPDATSAPAKASAQSPLTAKDANGQYPWDKTPITPLYAAPAPQSTTTPAPSGPGYPKPVEPGNIQWYGRPSVPMPGGRHGTVYSASREENGQEVLYPTIYDGKLHNDNDAWQHYKQTGEHMGKFGSIADADKYATQYHNDAQDGKFNEPPPNAGLAPPAGSGIKVEPVSPIPPLSEIAPPAITPASHASMTPQDVPEVLNRGKDWVQAGPVRAARGAKELVESGALSAPGGSGMRGGQITPTGQDIPVDPKQAMQGTTDLLSGGMTTTAPLAAAAGIPAIGLAMTGELAPLISMGVQYGIGIGAGKLAAATIKAAGGSQEAQDLAETVGAAGGFIAGTRAGLKIGFEPLEGGGRAGVSTPGGAVGVAGQVTPEAVQLRAKLGDWLGKIDIQRGGQPEATEAPQQALPGQVEQPSATEVSQKATLDNNVVAMSKARQAEQQAAVVVARVSQGLPPVEAPAPPPQPPTVTPQVVEQAAQHVESLPPEQQPQALMDSHKQLAGALAQQGSAVVDGKVVPVTSPKEAAKVAADIINDQVDKAEEAAKAVPEKGTTDLNSGTTSGQGKPDVFYHGTNQNIAELAPGSFVTSDPQEALAYALRRTSKPLEGDGTERIYSVPKKDVVASAKSEEIPGEHYITGRPHPVKDVTKEIQGTAPAVAGKGGEQDATLSSVTPEKGAGDKTPEPQQQAPAGGKFIDAEDERGKYRTLGDAVDVSGNWGRLKELPDESNVVLYHATTQANAEKIMREGFTRGDKPTNYGGDRDYTYLGGHTGLGSYLGGAAQNGGKPVILAVKVKKSMLEPDKGSDWKSHFKSNPNERAFAKKYGINVQDPTAVDTYAAINQVRARNEHVTPLGILDKKTGELKSGEPSTPPSSGGTAPQSAGKPETDFQPEENGAKPAYDVQPPIKSGDNVNFTKNGKQIAGTVEKVFPSNRMQIRDESGKLHTGDADKLQVSVSQQETAPKTPAAEASLPVVKPEGAQVGKETAKAPEAPVGINGRVLPKGTVSVKPPWEMSSDELASAEKDAKTEDHRLLTELFGGEEGAKKYERLQRQANGTMDTAKADRASEELAAMERQLTPEQEKQLYGQDGSAGPSHEDYGEFRSALNRLDYDSPKDLGNSLRWAITDIGDADMSHPEKMRPTQQLAYAAMREAFRAADEQGWDKNEVLQAAIRASASRFSDPEDAAFMLRRFTRSAESMGAAGSSPRPEVPKDQAAPRVSIEKAVEEKPVEKVVPGARSATTGNETSATTMGDLTDSIRRQVPSKGPILDRIKRASSIGADGAKDAVTAALGRFQGGMSALWEAYKNPPKWTAYEDATGKWSGADQVNAHDLMAFSKAIRDAVPDKLHREALSNWIEAGGDEAVLRDRADKSVAPFKAGYEAALKLTDAEKTIGQNIISRNDATLEEAQKAGILKDGVENYVRHVYKDDPKMERRVIAEMQFNSLITKPGFTKERKLPTYFDAEQLGFTPKDKDVGYLTAIHERSFREALAARDYIKSLMEGKAEDGRPLVTTSPSSAKQISDADGEKSASYLIKPNVGADEDYADYRTLDHPALRGWRWAGKTDAGESIFVQGDALVHPEIYAKLRNNLGRSGVRDWAVEIGGHTFHPGATALNVSQSIKGAILSLSGFHQTTLGAHALEHRTRPAFMADLDLNDPVEKKLVDHGLMVAHYDAEDAFGEGVASGGIVTKIPGIGPAYHAYSKYLFSDYLPRIKMAMAKNALKRNTEVYGKKLTEDQIYALTARQSNAAFGGLNMKMLGRNKTMQDVLRLGLMAPDFLEARGRFVGQAVKPYGHEQLAALLGGGLVLYTLARILNEMSDGQAHWDKPFAVVHHGKEYGMRFVQEDLYNLLTEPGKFAMNRLSPIVHTAIQVGEGRDQFGRKASIGKQAVNAAKSNVPIPLQPWTRTSHETKAEKAIESIYKMVGINVKKESQPKH